MVEGLIKKNMLWTCQELSKSLPARSMYDITASRPYIDPIVVVLSPCEVQGFPGGTLMVITSAHLYLFLSSQRHGR